MVRGGFRHLVVVDGGELVGVLSMRDIVRCWVQEGAVSEMPRLASPHCPAASSLVAWRQACLLILPDDAGAGWCSSGRSSISA